ncbi:hypothetical protein DDZ13_00405 [Coraliomargarita sinensis]|uniref:Transmembrane protein n=1 Tax=Coraliomargarita sinensis TaxID=2174842 RepID=A0A317ZPQ4_9BACT|nr:hypothetical protein [Coraliomargarita sinensis]PXA05361.1 hypothetical protein DDZ13_00405 [Coraliomargarita sinensis]
MNEDESHLRGLAIAHYVVGGFMILFACIPLIHTFIGLSVILGIEGMQQALAEGGEAPPAGWFGWLFFLIGLGAFLLGQAVSISVVVSGRFLRQRKHYWFSFVLACLACTFMPFGTVLGVLTIIVLSRDSVKGLYGIN